MRSLSLFICVVVIASAPAQTTAPTATPTTLGAETANNTSAAVGSQNGNAQPGNISKLPIRSLLYPGAETTILVHFMPWFGDHGHKEYGYHSDDERQLSRQVADMISRGIDGVEVDWYGPNGFKNHVAQLLLREAERQRLKFAIAEDAGALKDCEKPGCDLTQKLISDLRYAAEHFESSPAYLRCNDRPLVRFFGLEHTPIDWSRVRREVPGNPIFLVRNSGAFDMPFADGAYSWTASHTAGPGNPYAFDYLNKFYDAARRHPDKFAMASVYKGFDDSDAGWSKGKHIPQDCGRTWLRSFEIINRFYSREHPLPALAIVTWNDWEEGTEIESGIDNCVSIKASSDGGRLRWDVDGPRETLDHFEIFASSDGRTLSRVAQRAIDAHEVAVQDTQLGPGHYTFFVKAIAKPSLMNHLSNGVAVEIKAGR